MTSSFKFPFLWLVFFGLLLAANGQVQCTLSVDGASRPLKVSDKFTAQLTVQIEHGWHIASMTTPESGPMPTAIAVSAHAPCKLVGKIAAPEPIHVRSDAFPVEVETYEQEVRFTLPLEVTASLPPGAILTVEVTYQACSDKTCRLPRTDRVETVLVPKDKK